MQPDQQSDYFNDDPEKKEPGETPDVIEMYAPETDEEIVTAPDPVVADNSGSKKSLTDDDTVHWSAAEYISGHKNPLWFIVFAVVVLGLIAADVFLLNDYTFSVLIVVMAAAIIVFSSRPARTIDYTLSGDQGLYVGEKLYHFSEFKSFGVIDDRGNNSIMLMPVKRFSLGVFVYFPEEVGEEIVDILGARIPMENLKLDIVDIIVRKLRL